MNTRVRTFGAAAVLLASLTTAVLVGCDRKEKVIDIETADGEVEVFRDRDSGDVDIEIDSQRD